MSDLNGNLAASYHGGTMDGSALPPYGSSSMAPAPGFPGYCAQHGNYQYELSSPHPRLGQGQAAVAWWKKSVLYKGEMRIYGTNIPLLRTVLSLLFVLALYLGIKFILSLCTSAARFVSSVALIATIAYAYWALWWEEPIIIPPTISFFLCNNYSTPAIILCLSYESCLVGIVAFVVSLSLVFCSYEIKDIFVWEC